MTAEFLEDLFGGQEGIVYSPTITNRSKSNPDGKFTQHFFKWPEHKDKLLEHISKFSEKDVYIAPALFNAPAITRNNFKGTKYLWTEFDGIVPTGESVIEPTIKLQTSSDGHEHWFWKLDEFATDITHVTDLTSRIAYKYGADLSVWDYQNVLRIPDTWNHKHNKPVILLSKNSKQYRLEDFSNLPIPSIIDKGELKLGTLPTRDEVLAKYKFKEDTLDLLFKEVGVGSRSTALVRIAFDAIEAGCSNEEAYVLIEERDSVWKKYAGRRDREKQLKACIAHARSKIATKAAINQVAPEVYRFKDFMETDIKLEWVIDNVLPVAGTLLFLGMEGVGKTTMALRLGSDVALGREKFLNWKIKRRQKVLFVSLEMQHNELKQFFEDMEFPKQEILELQEWFHIWPIGHAYPFDLPQFQPELLKYVDMFDVKLVIIDSLGLSTYGSVRDDDTIKKLNAFLNEDLRKKRGSGYAFIHHFNKGDPRDPRKDFELDHSFGSRYITANSQSVIVMSQKHGSPRLNIQILKTRLSKDLRNFDLERTPNRGFVIAKGFDTPVSTTGSESMDPGRLKIADAGTLSELLNL